MTRLVLVGESFPPSAAGDENHLLALFPEPRTSAGGRLCELMGLTRGEYLRGHDRTNLLGRHPGKGWPASEARCAARALLPLLAGRSVVLVGARVHAAFGFADLPPLSIAPRKCSLGLLGEPGRCRMLLLPHTSGRNRWWNDAGNAEAARAALRDLLEGQL